jgi:hypothetical protein
LTQYPPTPPLPALPPPPPTPILTPWPGTTQVHRGCVPAAGPVSRGGHRNGLLARDASCSSPPDPCHPHSVQDPGGGRRSGCRSRFVSGVPSPTPPPHTHALPCLQDAILLCTLGLVCCPWLCTHLSVLPVVLSMSAALPGNTTSVVRPPSVVLPGARPLGSVVLPRRVGVSVPSLEQAADRGIDTGVDIGLPVQEYVQAVSTFSSSNGPLLVKPYSGPSRFSRSPQRHLEEL